MENGSSNPSWAGVTQQFMDRWTETSTQAWKNWFEVMNTTTHHPVTESKTGFDWLTQRLTENQELSLRLLRLSFSAWQEIFPKVEAGQNWQQSVDHYLQQIRRQIDDYSTSVLKISQDGAALWQLYLQETQKFSQLWANALSASVTPLSQGAFAGNPQPWMELNNLYWNLLNESTYGSVMRSPLLGPSREFNGKLLRTFDAWTTLYRATGDYQIVLADVQVRSLEELMRQLISAAEKGETIKDWRQFQQLWGRVADEVFEKAFCNETNLKVRGRFINALNAYRIQQRSLTELWMQALDIPTRSEIDEVHKTVYELRKELKTLKQSLAYSAEVHPASAAQATPAPTEDARTEKKTNAAPESAPEAAAIAPEVTTTPETAPSPEEAEKSARKGARSQSKDDPS